ncbi:PHP domain-containing protein [Litorihabitans aurantiacus]|uniref:PHP domain-containing protein n=1 Tax=Litorihabitans aurantiacus TaxID=1930061 RepID=A0AA37XD73_9MICO|nr:PHP domain-containing protein [Litorihabitans aurantiacus]GMA30523.1 PHP domain-containing protein [Litorihabitans aurantiacus]
MADAPGRSAAGAIDALREIAFWRERARVDTHRVKAYRRAADAVEALPPERVAELGTTVTAWTRIPDVGASTAKAIVAAIGGTVPEALAKARSEATPTLDPDDEAGAALFAHARGDLHMHTTASDGGSPMGEMVRVAARLGREYVAVSDHSPRLRVANGLSPERLRAQIEQVAELNAALADEGVGIRVLTAIEVDILEDGGLDQEPELLEELDVVVGSVHSELRMESAAMTRRMVRAVADPHLDVLGHCTGRLVEGARGTRPPSTFEAEIVFEACREYGTAVEINARPERRDPPEDLIDLALEADCLFSIDSDSHAPGQLDWLALGYSRAAARGVPAERIITTWPVEDLLRWTRTRER